jgi:hypothetical protein
MITDMIDLEPLLDQYDPETLLVGPLLGLSLSSNYRYFHIAGNGTKIYHAVGLGFVDSEADADMQRAEIIQKLKARFAEVVSFVSHPEMARAVHARWPSEEAARVLSSTEMAIKAPPAECPDQQIAAVTASTEGLVPGREPTVDGPAGGPLNHDWSIENPLANAPDVAAMRGFFAPEPNWHFRLVQGAAVVTREVTSSESPVQETASKTNHETGLTNNDDPFAAALARELFSAALPDQGPKAAPSLHQATAAHESPHRRISVEPSAKPEPARIGDREARHDLSSAEQSSQHHDQALDTLARELVEHTSDKERPSGLPRVVKLSPLAARRPEPAGEQQQPNFGLNEDDLASAVLKLKAALESKSLPNSTEPRPKQPDGTVVAAIERTPGRSSTITRFAALAATILLAAILVLPNTRQVRDLASLASPPLSNNSSVETQSGSAAPALTELGDAVNSAQHAQTTPSSNASLPTAPASEAPAGDVIVAAHTGQEALAATPAIMPSSPAAQPTPLTHVQTEPTDGTSAPKQGETTLPTTPVSAALGGGVTGAGNSGQHAPAATPDIVPSSPAAPNSPPTDIQTNITPLANKRLTTAAPSTVVSAPTALPSVAKSINTNKTNAPAVSGQQLSAAGDPAAADRSDAERIANLVSRGMQSLKNGDLESARRSLRRAVEAIPDSAVAPSPAGHDANDGAQVQASPATNTLSAAETEPAQPSLLLLAPVAGSNPWQPAKVARVEARPAPATAPTPSRSAAPVAAGEPATIAAPGGQTAPAMTPVSGPTRPSTSNVAAPDAGPAAVTTSAAQPKASLHLDQTEIMTLLKRGADFLRSGDFASARLLLRRAAEAGNAEAALALGSTYDPLMLRQLRAIGIAPDVAQARQWYQTAAELGASAAQQRLAKLPESGQ